MAAVDTLIQQIAFEQDFELKVTSLRMDCQVVVHQKLCHPGGTRWQCQGDFFVLQHRKKSSSQRLLQARGLPDAARESMC